MITDRVGFTAGLLGMAIYARDIEYIPQAVSVVVALVAFYFIVTSIKSSTPC